jgi:Skp family chaperone for outer membrane proteins
VESILASGVLGAILVAVAAIFRERNVKRKHRTERYQSDFQIGQRLRDELRAEMDRREQEYQADRREMEARITALEKDVERCHAERRELQELLRSLSAKPSAKRARKADGTFQGDDKSTPDVNEAYEQPKKKPAAKKKPTTKKNPPTPGILN